MNPYNTLININDKFPMVFISGGSFTMGNDESDHEKPAHHVNIASFYLAPYLVTQALWSSIMGESNNPSRFKGVERPVETISWYDIRNFLKILNEQTESYRQSINVGNYRLPTEAEWEFAARGGIQMEHNKSYYLYSGSDKLKEVGFYRDNSDEETHEVGLLMPNQLGLYDMSGNVQEWVEDHWHENYMGAPQNGTAWVNPDLGLNHVLRGGGYFNAPESCKVSCRSHNPPDNPTDYVGFRLALSLK